MDENAKTAKPSSLTTDGSTANAVSSPGVAISDTTSPTPSPSLGAALFSSAKMDWETPQDFFDKANENLGPFHLDAAASEDNHKCPMYFDMATDALKQPWHKYGNVWCNPPYGRNIIHWVKKASGEARLGGYVVMLLPSRTDTKWFHQYCANQRVIFIEGRLKFVGAESSAPFPSILVIFGKRKDA